MTINVLDPFMFRYLVPFGLFYMNIVILFPLSLFPLEEAIHKSDVMVLKLELAPYKTILLANWPVPDHLAVMANSKPTPSPQGYISTVPTPSPKEETGANPTPSPISKFYTPTATPRNDKQGTTTPSPIAVQKGTPSPWTTKESRTSTPSPTEKVGNSTVSITAEVSKSTTTTTTIAHISTLPATSNLKHDLSTTAGSGARTASKAESINLYLVILSWLMVRTNH